MEPLNEKYKSDKFVLAICNNWNIPSPNTQKKDYEQVSSINFRTMNNDVTWNNCSQYYLKARDELPKSMDKYKPLSSKNDASEFSFPVFKYFFAFWGELFSSNMICLKTNKSIWQNGSIFLL